MQSNIMYRHECMYMLTNEKNIQMSSWPDLYVNF